MKHQKKAKVTKIKQKDKDYSKREASPYWEFLDNGGEKGGSGALEFLEPSEANPDVLPESAGFWGGPKELTYEQEDRLELIKAHMADLTELQRNVLMLVAMEGKTYSHAAAILGVTKGSIQEIIERLRADFNKLI